jgi:hypothetical protein
MLYQSHRKTCFLLDQSVRQEEGTPFRDALKRIRDGTINSTSDNQLTEDLQFWSQRKRDFFDQEEQELFSLKNCETVEGTCFNKDRDLINRNFIKLFQSVRVIQSENHGIHALSLNHQRQGMIKNLPRKCFYAPGMMIKLSCNICITYGLTNNSRGIIRDILYRSPNDIEYVGYNPNASLNDIILMVEISNYIGPQLNDNMIQNNQLNWIPIIARQLKCECSGCSRNMFPIVVAKADSVYCLQGLTVGDNKLIKRVVLNWNAAGEAKWPNIFYVGTSRAEQITNFALANDLSRTDLAKIGTFQSVLNQMKEMKELSDIAYKFRESNNITIDNYLKQINWLIKYVNSNVINENIPDSNKKQVITSCINQWVESINNFVD